MQLFFLTLKVVIFIAIDIPEPYGVNSSEEIMIPEKVGHDLL